MAIFSFITDGIIEFRAIRLGNQAVKALQAGNYSASEELNRRALAIMERTFGNIDQTAVYTYNLGQVFLAQDRLSEAVPFFERTMQILDSGADDEQFGSVAQQLADVLRKLGRDNEAEQMHALAEARRNTPAQAIVKEAEAFGPEDPRLIEALNNLGKLHFEQEQYAEAEPVLRRLLAIRERTLGPNDLFVADTLANLAITCEELSRPEEAEVLYRRAISIHESQPGIEPPIMASFMSSLAALLRSVGNTAEADRLVARSEAIVGKHADIQPSDWLHPNLGHRFPPMCRWYHIHASGLIGSPTVPRSRRVERSCCFG